MRRREMDNELIDVKGIERCRRATTFRESNFNGQSCVDALGIFFRIQRSLLTLITQFLQLRHSHVVVCHPYPIPNACVC